MRVGALRAGSAVTLLLTGCALGRLPAPVGTAVPDADAFARELAEQNLPVTPEQITFAWTLDEGGSRVRGRGVVRAEAPERMRLDLFGPRGETYLVAALVGSEYRLPPNVAGAMALPSPALLWSAMGVLRPPPTSALESATAEDGRAELRYRTPEGELFVYSFERSAEGIDRLSRLERAGRQGVRESVNLERTPEGALRSAHYRDWSEYRDLLLEIESIRVATPFAPSTWMPDAPPF